MCDSTPRSLRFNYRTIAEQLLKLCVFSKYSVTHYAVYSSWQLCCDPVRYRQLHQLALGINRYKKVPTGVYVEALAIEGGAASPQAGPCNVDTPATPDPAQQTTTPLYAGPGPGSEKQQRVLESEIVQDDHSAGLEQDDYSAAPHHKAGDTRLSQHEVPAEPRYSEGDMALLPNTTAPHTSAQASYLANGDLMPSTYFDHQAKPAQPDRALIASEPPTEQETDEDPSFAYRPKAQLGVGWVVTNVHFGLPLFNLDVSTMVRVFDRTCLVPASRQPYIQVNAHARHIHTQTHIFMYIHVYIYLYLVEIRHLNPSRHTCTYDISICIDKYIYVCVFIYTYIYILI